MSTGSRGPQQLKYHIVQSRVYCERDDFIAAIHEDDICRLASSYYNGDLCSFFKPPTRGSYNICYFVQFPLHSSNEDGEKWVARVPLAPCLAYGSRTKLESEIATMQLVADKTAIPLPKIYAHRLGDGLRPLSSFVLLEYIEGQKLSSVQLKSLSDEQQNHLYTSLADIHIQLRRLEFPSIGCLTRHLESFDVRKKIVTIDINMQELEGLQPSKIQAPFYDDKGLLLRPINTWRCYFSLRIMCLRRVEAVSLKKIRARMLYIISISSASMSSSGWIAALIKVPLFWFRHLEPFSLIVNENMDITSVLDWEWSRIVPVQFFKPPLWLTNLDTTKLTWNFVYKDYLMGFDYFLEIMRIRERAKYRNELLSAGWAKAKENSGFLVANALENWTDMDWFANRYINWKFHHGKAELEKRIKPVMEKPVHKYLIVRKLREGIAYRVDVDRLEGTAIKAAPS